MNLLTVFKKIIAIYIDSPMKPINTLRVQNVELLIDKEVVQIVITKLQRVKHSGRGSRIVHRRQPSNIGILGSNLTQDMNVCPHISVLCCPV